MQQLERYMQNNYDRYFSSQPIQFYDNYQVKSILLMTYQSKKQKLDNKSIKAIQNNNNKDNTNNQIDFDDSFIKNHKLDHKHKSLNTKSNKQCIINSGKYNDKLCICKICTCSKHQCKLHPFSPRLTKATIYQTTFTNKNGKPSTPILAFQPTKSKGFHLDMSTIYKKQYSGSKGDKLERPHPTDLIHTGGPFLEITSYSSGHPGHCGLNQYVKPTNKSVIDYYPLKGKTTYQRHYQLHIARRPLLQKKPDTFDVGMCKSWLGNSTYRETFRIWNPEEQNKQEKYSNKNHKLKKRPNSSYAHQSKIKNQLTQ